MNTSRLWRVSTLLLVMALASCDNERGLTAPPEVAEPSLGKIGDEQDPDAQRIESLIIALHPGPGLENEALVRWANIQRQLSRGQLQAARSQARTLAEQVIHFAAAGLLEAPADPMLPGTVDLAVTELVTRLFGFVGLEVSDALQEYSDDLPEDFGFGTVDPDEGGIITTSNAWAAVVAGPGVTDGVVFVTIELLDEEMCAVADPLTQARGCWNIERYPEGAFNEDVKVEICVADNPAMSDDEWDLLLVHRKADDGTVNPLPWSEPTGIDCTGFGSEAPQQTAHNGRVTSLLALARSRLADLLLPESLGASVMADRPPRGLGGTTGVFSDFFGAVPATTPTVSGTVRYSATPLAGVRVTLFPDGSPDSAVETYTDETGRYGFTGVTPGNWTVRAYGQGYPNPEDPNDYPFHAWVGRSFTVAASDQVVDIQLPKVIQLLSPPDGATVNPQGLTLTWEPNAEAAAGGGYSIQINDTDHWFPTAEVGQGTEPGYQVQDARSPGETYTWQVDARDAEGRWVGSTIDAFEYTIPEGSWALAGNLLGPRRDHAALLLGDGTVLVNGGTRSEVELFDPATGTSTLLLVSGTGQGSTATLLPDGRVLRVGPYGTDILDPATGTVTPPTAGPDGRREYHAAILLPDGRVLIAGGRGFDPDTGERWDRADAEIFDPATDAFTTLTDSLSVARHLLATAVLPDGKVLLAGGTYLTSPGYGETLAVADIFDPATGMFTPTGSMNHVRSGPIATLLPTGKVLITGGWYAQPELYDPASGTFSLTGPTNDPRWAHTATLLADGRVLLTGGVESGPVTLNSAEVYDPGTGTFTRVAWMTQDRQQHSALLLPDGRVLVLGGYDFATNGGSDLATAEIFTPGGG